MGEHACTSRSDLLLQRTTTLILVSKVEDCGCDLAELCAEEMVEELDPNCCGSDRSSREFESGGRFDITDRGLLIEEDA